MKLTVAHEYFTTVTNEDKSMVLVLEEYGSGYSYQFAGPGTLLVEGKSDALSQTRYAVLFEAFQIAEESGDMEELTRVLRQP